MNKIQQTGKRKALSFIGIFWHGHVLHEGITYKSRVPRISQMTSRLLRHTDAAMRAHNVLCNSYNTRPLLCARITCYVTVTTVEINHCSFSRVRFYAYRLYFINVWHVYEWPKTYTWSGTFILKDGRYTFTFYSWRAPSGTGSPYRGFRLHNQTHNTR
jgi:hypothetical protein